MILQIAPDYYNTALYANLFSSLHQQGINSRIYVTDNTLHQDDKTNNIFCAPKAFNLLERLLFFPKQQALYNDLHARDIYKGIDVIHAHTLFSSGYLAYQLYQKYGIPYIVAVRNTDVNIFFRYMPHLRHIGREIALNAKKVIFISPAYQQQVVGKYLPDSIDDKSIVIPNGINPLFLNNISQHQPATDAIRLIYTGKIEKNKNIDTLIRVSDKLVASGKKVTLCMVGKLIDQCYKSLIEQRDYIDYYDQSSQEEVMHYMRQHDIFIMPSYHETFGLVYAEAMSQGLPVIYTRGQGFDGYFEDGEIGYSVSATNLEEIIQRITEIYAHYKTISDQCINLVQRFDWQQIAKEYSQIYKSL